jgi:cytidylate kinase
MNTLVSSERVVEMMERFCRARQAAETRERPHSVSASPPLTIALSRQAGTRGSAVAREIGQRLGWPVYDYALVETIAREMGVRAMLIESVDERRVHWLTECVEQFGSASGVSSTAYFRHLKETLAGLAAHGECVIVGRGAAQFLPRQSTLRVRLVASLKDRIAVTSRERGLTWEEAADYIDRIDRHRIQFVREHFQTDATDPELYDQVINAGRFSVVGCAQLCIDSLRWLQSRFRNSASAEPEVREEHPVPTPA